ncbi:hypothetical protein AB0F11_34210, partial [Streptomyces sp. NPDC032472]
MARSPVAFGCRGAAGEAGIRPSIQGDAEHLSWPRVGPRVSTYTAPAAAAAVADSALSPPITECRKRRSPVVTGILSRHVAGSSGSTGRVAGHQHPGARGPGGQSAQVLGEPGRCRVQPPAERVARGRGQGCGVEVSVVVVGAQARPHGPCGNPRPGRVGVPERRVVHRSGRGPAGPGREALPGIEARLAAEHLRSAWRLLPDLHVGVVALRRQGADEAVLRVLERSVTVRVGVSPPYRFLGETPKALRLARLALTGARGRPAGVARFDDSPAALLVAAAPDEAGRIARAVLEEVLRLPAAERDRLL